MTEFLRTVSKSFETANDLRSFIVLVSISPPKVRIEIGSNNKYLKFLDETLAMVEFWESGRLWSESFFKNKKRHGKHREFYSNGKQRVERNYFDGESHGLHREWDLDGNIEWETYCKNNILDGPYTSWFNNGNIQSTGHFKNDKRDGIWYYYNRDSRQKEVETRYRDGIVVFRYISR